MENNQTTKTKLCNQEEKNNQKKLREKFIQQQKQKTKLCNKKEEKNTNQKIEEKIKQQENNTNKIHWEINSYAKKKTSEMNVAQMTFC